MTTRFKIWFASVAAFIISMGSSSAFAQGVVESVPVEVEREAMLMTSMVLGFVSSWFIEWWKNNPHVGVITEFTEVWVQRTIAVIIAAGTSIGIGYSFDASAGVLTITGLTWATIGGSAWEIFKQFIIQEFAYRTSFKRNK